MALYRSPSMPQQIFDPYTIPAVHPGRLEQEAPVSMTPPTSGPRDPGYVPDTLYEITRQFMVDALEGMKPQALRALALAAAAAAVRAEQEQVLKYYRIPRWYAVNIGAQGQTAAPIAAGATSPGATNRYRTDAGFNFEAYQRSRWTQDTVTGAINSTAFRSKVLYSGMRGVTSDDETAALAATLRQPNAWGTAERPGRMPWPMVHPASSDVEHEFTNDGANPVNAQLVWFGNHVACGESPRRIIARPPFRREPFTFAMSWNAIAAGIQVNSNLQMLQNADFELLYITQFSPSGNAGDFELQLKEGDGGNAELSNIPIRRDAGYGSIERPTILYYPRYFARGSRIIGLLTNRDFAGAAQSFQVALHGNLII